MDRHYSAGDASKETGVCLRLLCGNGAVAAEHTMVEGSRVRLVETFAGQRAGRSEFHARHLTRDVSQGSDEASINFVTDDRIQVSPPCFPSFLLPSSYFTLLLRSTRCYPKAFV